jgi:hypothetical protein
MDDELYLVIRQNEYIIAQNIEIINLIKGKRDNNCMACKTAPKKKMPKGKKVPKGKGKMPM